MRKRLRRAQFWFLVLAPTGCALVSISTIACASAAEPLSCVYSPKITEGNQTPELGPQGACAVKTEDGEIRVLPAHLGLLDFRFEGLAAVNIERQFYYIRKDGVAAAVLAQDNGPDTFSEGLVRIRRGGKIGFMDTKLRIAIQATYDFAWRFQGGRALVCIGCTKTEADSEGHRQLLGGRWGYIGPDGVEVVPIRLTKEEVQQSP